MCVLDKTSEEIMNLYIISFFPKSCSCYVKCDFGTSRVMLYIIPFGRCMHVISTHNRTRWCNCEVTSLLYIVDGRGLIKPTLIADWAVAQWQCPHEKVGCWGIYV
jgi:hypothetical protein